MRVAAKTGEAGRGYVFAIMPFFAFVIAWIGVAQAYVITTLGMRVRAIERRVTELHGGKPFEKLRAPEQRRCSHSLTDPMRSSHPPMRNGTPHAMGRGGP